MIPIFLLLLLFSQPGQCLVASECYWLRIIYQKMGGDVSLIPVDCCQMDGIICSDDDHITEIDWIGQDLTGTIAPEIGMLTHLQEL
jgi:hypothetical protein